MKTFFLLFLITITTITLSAQTTIKFDDKKTLTINAPFISEVIENDQGKPNLSVKYFYQLKDSVITIYEYKIVIATKKLYVLKHFSIPINEIDVNDFIELEENKPNEYYSKSFYFVRFNAILGKQFTYKTYSQEDSTAGTATEAFADVMSYNKELIQKIYADIKLLISNKE